MTMWAPFVGDSFQGMGVSCHSGESRNPVRTVGNNLSSPQEPAGFGFQVGVLSLLTAS
jgi:hypothetical protein